jgi:hypothetical protein
LANLRKLAETYGAAAASQKKEGKEDDDVPELVENFDDAANKQ